MSVENEKDAVHRQTSGQTSESRKPQPKKKGASDAEVGSALRNVYQCTVEEQIPPDLLDLLGKLG